MPNPGRGGTIVPRPAVPALERESAWLLPMPVKVCPSRRQSCMVRGSLPSSPRGQRVEWLAGVSTTGHTRPAAETSAAPGGPRRRYRRPDRAQTGPRRPDSEYGIAAYRVPRARSAAMNEFWHGTGSPSRPKLSRLTVSTLSSYLRHVFHACQCGGPSGVSCRGWWSRPDSDAGYPQYGGRMAAVLDLSYWIRWGSASAVRSVSPRPGTPGSGRMTPPAGSSVPSKNSDSIRT